MPRKSAAPRRPRAPANAAFYDAAQAGGWTITRRGWPDWWCTRTREDGEAEVAVVLVRQHRGRRLKRDQRAILRVLAAAGIPCYEWSLEQGYAPIPPF
jgi:hypothetical protein